MARNLDVRFVRNDQSIEFNLKAEGVQVKLGNNMVARSIISAAGDIAGSDPVLNTETYQVTGIKFVDMTTADYPHKDSHWGDTVAEIPWKTKDARGNVVEIPSGRHNQRAEAALRYAVRGWGPDADEGFDQLYWKDQWLSVVATSYNAKEAAADPKSGVYTIDLELTHVSAYMG